VWNRRWQIRASVQLTSAPHSGPSGGESGTLGNNAQDGVHQALMRTAEANDRTVAEMAECLVELADSCIDVSETLEVLGRGIQR
jgi:hypothetical protein